MKQAIRLGIVCLARETYDFVAAAEIYKKIITGYKRPKLSIGPSYPDLVISIEDAKKAAMELSADRRPCMHFWHVSPGSSRPRA